MLVIPSSAHYATEYIFTVPVWCKKLWKKLAHYGVIQRF